LAFFGTVHAAPKNSRSIAPERDGCKSAGDHFVNNQADVPTVVTNLSNRPVGAETVWQGKG
jgi:hypothetical protein